MAFLAAWLVLLVGGSHGLKIQEFFRRQLGAGTVCIEAFAAENQTYLITADYLGGTATVLRFPGWEGSRRFQLVQRLHVQAPLRVLPVLSVDGRLLLLVSRKRPSTPVYEWTDGGFSYLASMPSPPVMSWHAFDLGGLTYLAAAVFDGESLIFVHRAPDVFERVLALPGTARSTSLAHIVQNESAALLIACAGHRAVGFPFDGKVVSRRVELGGRCGSIAAASVEGRRTCVSVMSWGSGSLYCWEEKDARFQLQQRLPAVGWAMSRFFAAEEGGAFLAIASRGEPEPLLPSNLTLWRWVPERQKFGKKADIVTHGAYWVAPFRLDGVAALALVEGSSGDEDEDDAVTLFLLESPPPLTAEVGALAAAAFLAAVASASYLCVRPPSRQVPPEGMEPIMGSLGEQKQTLRGLSLAVALSLTWNVCWWLVPKVRLQLPCEACRPSTGILSRLNGLSVLLALCDSVALVYCTRRAGHIRALSDVASLRGLYLAMLLPCYPFFIGLALPFDTSDSDKEPYRVMLGVELPEVCLVLLKACPLVAAACAYPCLRTLSQAVAFDNLEAVAVADAAFPQEVLSEVWEWPGNPYRMCGIMLSLLAWTRVSAASALAAALWACLVGGRSGIWVLFCLQCAALAASAPALSRSVRLTFRARERGLNSVSVALGLGVLSCALALLRLVFAARALGQAERAELLALPLLAAALLFLLRFMRLYLTATRRLAIRQGLGASQEGAGVELH